MAKLPADTRLLALALLNYADDKGYFNANSALIKSECCPLDESANIPRMIDELSRDGYIRIGKADDGKTVGHVINFLEHQRIDKPKESIISCKSITWYEVSETSKTNQGSLLDASRPEGKGKEQGKDQKPLGAKAPAAGKLNSEFEEAWKRYPKRAGNNPKADALKAWNARIAEKVPVEDMNAGLDRYIAYCDATDKVGTELVMQAVRFFGKARPFEQEFVAPRKTAANDNAWKQDDNAILAKSVEVGVSIMGLNSFDAVKRIEQKIAALA